MLIRYRQIRGSLVVKAISLIRFFFLSDFLFSSIKYKLLLTSIIKWKHKISILMHTPIDNNQEIEFHSINITY